MGKAKLKSRKVLMPSATMRKMKTGSCVKINTSKVKSNNLRVTASRLKEEGYEFRISVKDQMNETIVECIKTPML